MKASPQTELNLATVMIVPNHWGPVFHIVQDGSLTYRYDVQPSCFFSVESALEWAAQFGCTPKVHEDCQYVTPDPVYWEKYCQHE